MYDMVASAIPFRKTGELSEEYLKLMMRNVGHDE